MKFHVLIFRFTYKKFLFVFETDALNGMQDQRAFFFWMEELGLDVPVIF